MLSSQRIDAGEDIEFVALLPDKYRPSLPAL